MSDKFLTCLVDYFIAHKSKEVAREIVALVVIITNKEGLFSGKSCRIKGAYHLRVPKAKGEITRYVSSQFEKQI